MAGIGSSIEEGGRAERRTRFALSACLRDRCGYGEETGDELSNTIPGESRILSLLSNLICRSDFVTPASAPTGQDVFDALEEPRREDSALITDDLPTLG